MSTLQRPIGFSPQEISTMVNEVVVEQHAENAAFLWTQRDQAVHAPHYYLNDLADLDERVEANLDGLRVAGDVGWQLCEQALESQEPGEVFPSGVLAFGSGNEERIQKVLEVAVTDPGLERSVISALAWLSFDQVKESLSKLMSSEVSECRRIAIGVYAVCREDLGDWLKQLLSDSTPRVRARALRAVGELGRKDLLPSLRQALDDQDDTCQFWATWSAARLGERTPAPLGKLRTYVESLSEYSATALAMALRCMKWDEAKQWRVQLRDNPATLWLAIKGIGILGDPALVPELLTYMENKELCRIAGESFSMITGVDLAYADLDQDKPEESENGEGKEEIEDELAEDDEEVPNDLDIDLPWPHPEVIGRWWADHQSEFEISKRYLCGKNLTFSTLLEVIRKGSQRQREAAALEQAIWNTEEPLFEVRAIGKTQLQK